MLLRLLKTIFLCILSVQFKKLYDSIFTRNFTLFTLDLFYFNCVSTNSLLSLKLITFYIGIYFLFKCSIRWILRHFWHNGKVQRAFHRKKITMFAKEDYLILRMVKTFWWTNFALDLFLLIFILKYPFPWGYFNLDVFEWCHLSIFYPVIIFFSKIIKVNKFFNSFNSIKF